MKKGIVFSTESMYLLIATFVVVEALIISLPNVNQPNYDLISTLKVAHDMGQSNTSEPPLVSQTLGSYSVGLGCASKNAVVEISYYDYGAAINKKVCSK